MWAADTALTALNLRHLAHNGRRVPRGFEGEAPPDKLARAVAYGVESGRLGLTARGIETTMVLAFVFGGGLAAWDRWVAALSLGFVGRGVIFALGLVWARAILGLPFDGWRTFRVETRHGFNTTRPGLWWADRAKGLAVGSVLAGLLVAGALTLIRAMPGGWWAGVWGLYAALYHSHPPVVERLRALRAARRGETFRNGYRTRARDKGPIHQ